MLRHKLHHISSQLAVTVLTSDPNPTPWTTLLPGGSPAVLQGGISLFGVVRPITLRNLVLYNLAPGGMYPEGAPAAPLLSYNDAAWRYSALPLWFFQCARSGWGARAGGARGGRGSTMERAE